MVLLVLSIALLSAIFMLSAAEDTYVIKPRPDTPCLILLQPMQVVSHSLRVYARKETFLSQHHTGVSPSSCSFTMVGSLFSSSSSLGEPTTTISCIGPATLSFYEIQEVKLQTSEFVNCGDIDQPAIMVSSVQYFETIECRLKDSRSFVVIAYDLTLYSTSFHGSLIIGLIAMNGFTKFTGNSMLFWQLSQVWWRVCCC